MLSNPACLLLEQWLMYPVIRSEGINNLVVKKNLFISALVAIKLKASYILHTCYSFNKTKCLNYPCTYLMCVFDVTSCILLSCWRNKERLWGSSW